MGNTPLHYACQNVAINVLPEILELETDVDLKNKLKGDTPLHVAVGIEHKEARNWVGELASGERLESEIERETTGAERS